MSTSTPDISDPAVEPAPEECFCVLTCVKSHVMLWPADLLPLPTVCIAFVSTNGKCGGTLTERYTVKRIAMETNGV